MVKNIYVQGSCASRDVFNSQINHNYKDYFSIKGTSSQMSLISLMQSPIEYEINNEFDEFNNFQIQVFESEFKKTPLKEIIDLNLDYLILDNYFEMRFGVLCSGDLILTNNYWNLTDTSYYKNLKDKKLLNVYNNFNDYFKLWTKYCNDFFEYLNKYKPNLKVILNPVRNATSVLSEEGIIIDLDENTKNNLIQQNKFIFMFDEYILKNFDVDLISFEKSFKADKNHPWNFNYVNYENEYYKYFTNKLNLIIERNELLGNDDINKNIRLNKNKMFLYNQRLLYDFLYYKNDDITNIPHSYYDDLIKEKKHLNNKISDLKKEINFLNKKISLLNDDSKLVNGDYNNKVKELSTIIKHHQEESLFLNETIKDFIEMDNYENHLLSKEKIIHVNNSIDKSNNDFTIKYPKLIKNLAILSRQNRYYKDKINYLENRNKILINKLSVNDNNNKSFFNNLFKN